MRRFCILATSAVALTLAAGCGGDEGVAVGGGAEVAPASSALFASVNTDFDGEQWRQAEELLDRFPAGREALGDMLNQLEAEDVDFEQDVKPAVGPEVIFIVPDFEGDDAVVLTQPEDPAKFQELVEKGDESGVSEEIDGWWAGARSQEALDRYKAAKDEGSLSDNDDFKDAMEDLPEDAAARVYVNGQAFNEAAMSQAQTTPEQQALVDCFGGDEATGGLGMALSAEDNGARLVGTSAAGAFEAPEDGSWDVIEDNTGGALGFFATRGLGEQIRRILECVSDSDEDVSRQIAQAELLLGVSISEDLLPLFDDETVLAVHQAESPGAEGQLSFATFSLITEVADEDQAKQNLDKITSRLRAFSEDVSIEDVSIGDASAKRVTVSGEDLIVYYGVYDGRLVVTTTEEGITSVAGGTDANSAYDDAREAAGAPEESGAVTWVDVPAAVAFANELLGAAGGVPQDASENLEPLKSILFWSEGSGDRVHFEGFLEIE